MKRVLYFFSFLISFSLFANSGFTFLSSVSHELNLPEHTLSLALVVASIFILGGIYRMRLANCKTPLIPDSKITFRNIVEVYGQFMLGQCKAVLGDRDGEKFFSFFASLFLVILISNLVGLIPGFVPPTENLNTTLAFGIISFAYYNIQGCRTHGVINYFKHFMGPLWYMAVLIFPIEIISNSVRPISLAFRLRGNMFGDHLVLEIFGHLAPYIVPVIFMVLGLLVSFIQAYVFTILSMVYIGLATEHQDHEAGEHSAVHH